MPKLATRYVEARGPMTAAHLVLAGFPVLAVSVASGRPSYIFDLAANGALHKYLDVLAEMHALAERASQASGASDENK